MALAWNRRRSAAPHYDQTFGDKALPFPWIGHEPPTFVRACLHLVHRASLHGVDVSPDVCGGLLHGLAPGWVKGTA